MQLLSPDALFFGLADASTNNLGFVILPLIVALVTILMAALAIPLGPLLTSMPPLRAYAVDVSGSMAGIAGFAVLSALSTPPAIWFAVVAGLLALLALGKPITRWSVLTGAAMAGVIALSIVQSSGSIWSPYYRINVYREGGAEGLNVNGIPYQYFPLSPGATLFPFYHQVYQWLPGRTFDHVLIVGSGTGDDVSVSLAHGAKSVDAVEIDPEIAAIGARDNPSHPYSDPRVTLTINDGRAFLRNTDQRYDLVVFALPDSLTLVTSTANIRLESFLFTDEAFASVRQHLAPGGVFVLYNFYRQPWLVDKLAGMLQQTFGAPPLVATYPQLGDAAAAMADGPGTMTAAVRRSASAGAATGQSVASPVGDPPIPATDDWPFLYLLTPTVAPVYLVTMLLVLLWAGLLTWRASSVSGTSFRRFSPHFFLLGVAFMLLETRSLVTFSLLFGTTWLVNALVFFAILASVLAAILVNARLRLSRPRWLYAGLFGALALAYVLPSATLLIDPLWLRYALASAIAFAPVFLANLVFTYSFRDTRTADMSFASNLLGAMVGAVLEYVSLVTGYQALLLLVAIIYALAFLAARRFRLLADVDLVAA